MTDLSKIINEQRDRIAELERQLKEVELDKIDETALVMAGARKIANKSSATSNAGLFIDLFDSDFFTAVEWCKKLGLDPEGDQTSYNSMGEHLRQQLNGGDQDG